MGNRAERWEGGSEKDTPISPLHVGHMLAPPVTIFASSSAAVRVAGVGPPRAAV